MNNKELLVVFIWFGLLSIHMINKVDGKEGGKL